MERILIVIGLTASAVLIGASATMNYIFASSLGQSSFEGHVLGAVSVAVDIMKALLAVFIASAARDGKRTFVLVGSLAFALFTVASMLAATGFTATNRGAVAAKRAALTQQLAAAERDLDLAERARAALPSHRPSALVAEEIAALRINIRWSASKACSVPVTTAQREHCLLHAHLRTALAVANEADRLHAEALAHRRTIDRLRQAGDSVGDQQAQLLAQVFGMDEVSIQRLLMALVALVVEVSSGLGVYLATGHRSQVCTSPNPDKAKFPGQQMPLEPSLPPKPDMKSPPVADLAPEENIKTRPRIGIAVQRRRDG